MIHVEKEDMAWILVSWIFLMYFFTFTFYFLYFLQLKDKLDEIKEKLC